MLRIGESLLAVAALTVFVSGLPLLGCPFLQGGFDKEQHHCCPPSEQKKCPLSSTLETCPYYVTDSKLGMAQVKRDTLTLPVAATSALLKPAALLLPNASQSAQSLPFDGTGLYLTNRVLRI
jgi:hypothetical protein